MSNQNNPTKVSVSSEKPALGTTKVRKTGQKAKAVKSFTPKVEGEPTDRLPTSQQALKETKGGFVATLFLGGTDPDGIAKELKVAFKLSDAQAMKITRRIIGRARLYQRIFELVPVKK